MKKIYTLCIVFLAMFFLGIKPAEARSFYTPWDISGTCSDNSCVTHHDSVIIQQGEFVSWGVACSSYSATNSFWIHVYRENGTVKYSVHDYGFGYTGYGGTSDTFDAAQTISINFQMDRGGSDYCNWEVYAGDAAHQP